MGFESFCPRNTHFFGDWTPERVMTTVRTHSPTKRCGDDFAADFAAFVRASPQHSVEEKRCLFVVSCMILVPRSAQLLQYFKEHGSFIGPRTPGQLYEWCLTKKCIYPGLDRGRRSYQSHTTEQKIVGVGALLDLFVGPYLLDPSHFDVHLNFEEGAQFISDVSTCPWLKGALLHTHFCDLCYSGRHDEGDHGATNTRQKF